MKQPNISVTVSIDMNCDHKDVVGVDEHPNEHCYMAEIMATCGDIQVVDTSYMVAYDDKTGGNNRLQQRRFMVRV